MWALVLPRNSLLNLPLKEKETFEKSKKRNCWLPAFSTFPKKFSKTIFRRKIKTLDCEMPIETEKKMESR